MDRRRNQANASAPMLNRSQGKAEHIYGDLPGGWNLVPIHHLVSQRAADVQTGPFGTMLHASAYVPGGTPVVAVRNIGENQLVHDDIPRIDGIDVARLERYKLKPGDILFGRKGEVQRRALVRPEEEGWLQGSDCIRLRILTEDIDARFISYVLGTDSYRSWISRNAHGATMPSLNQEIIGRIPLPIPPISEQWKIAHILSKLDDKIELNRRMNDTLEAMARATFKSWFVDFDPVRAKAEGLQPSAMDAATAALFPDSFRDSPLGKIPKGWRTSAVGDVIEIGGGSTPSTRETTYWDGEVHWLPQKTFRN